MMDYLIFSAIIYDREHNMIDKILNFSKLFSP